MLRKLSCTAILASLILCLLVFPVIIQDTNALLYFSDTFDDGVADGWTEHLGLWSVINGEYFISVGVVENGISTVDETNLVDCAIETKLRFTDAVGFRAGIVFRYIGSAQYYCFELSNECDCLGITKYTLGQPEYGTSIAYLKNGAYPIQANVDYVLKVILQGNVFRCFVNGIEVLSGTDETYTSGKVGLRARRADAFFDNFKIDNVVAPTPPSNGLVGYWKLDEGSGTVAHDSSGYDNDGTLFGSISWVNGKCGKALSFGGGGSYVLIPHSSDLEFAGVHPFTLEAWIKPDNPQGTSGSLAANIIDKFSNYGLVFDHGNPDARGVVIRSGGIWHHSGQVGISAGVWHHYVGVYDPPHLIAYLDGYEVARREVGYLTLDVNTNNLVFGTNMELTSQYNGVIDEIKIYSKALSAQEIQNLYGSSQPSPTPSPSPGKDVYSDDFSTDSGMWEYLGSAYRDQANQYIVLTAPIHDQGGAAFFNVPFKSSFTANFSYKVGGGTGGDGFTIFFYKQKYSSIGYGGSLGFNWGPYPGSIPGYGIEFDNWKNIAKSDEHADPSANHIALIKDHIGNHLTFVDDARTEDNNWHKVTVDVQESSVRVFVDQDLVLEWKGEFNRTFDRFGFSAGTGSGTNWHLIDDFSIVFGTLEKPDIAASCRSSTSYSGFNVEIKGILTFNGTGLSEAPILLSYSVTGGKSWEDLTLVYTSSDGSYSAVWMPSVTGNYLVKATYEGDDSYPETSVIVNLAVTQFAERNVFSVASNSTISSLIFNSETQELSFTVTGPSGTTGYVDIYVPKSLIANIANVKACFDGVEINYTATSVDDSWLLHFFYQHSTHEVLVSLGPQPSQFLLNIKTELAIIIGAVIAVIVAVVLVALWRRRSPKSK